MPKDIVVWQGSEVEGFTFHVLVRPLILDSFAHTFLLFFAGLQKLYNTSFLRFLAALVATSVFSLLLRFQRTP